MTDRRRGTIDVALLAGLVLFLELALIRWLGANVLYLGYFSNVVLLGSFLGVGLGFLRAGRSERPLLPFTALALAALVVAVRLVDVEVGVSGSDLIFFGIETSGPSRVVVLPIVFGGVAAVLLCVGDGLARAFRQLGNLEAYGLDVLGSIAGSALFAVLAFLHAAPFWWGVIIGGLLLATIRPHALRPRPWWLAVTCLPLLVVLGTWSSESFDADTEWTPYYKTTAEQGPAGVVAVVNGIPTWFQQPVADSPIYQTVYERMTRDDPGRVLIIGAGSGNDVAAALGRGAERVDAVDIDGHLLDLGRQHPDRPYDDPRVTTHVADGRAFLERSDEKWDVILFALPDSLTLIQGQSALRLESFLFTAEALETARDRLSPDGVFAMYNYYREPWLRDRFAGMAEDAFGQPPCVSSVLDTVLNVITVSPDAGQVACPTDEQWARPADVVEPATDDRPFPYLRGRTVPAFYLGAAGVILLGSLLLVRVLGGPLRELATHVDLFFLGVAFLLLESKSVVQFALLFGTTWFVNVLVFIGVLTSVFVAILVTRAGLVRRPDRLFPLLFVGLAVAWAVPNAALLQLGPWPRFLVAAVITFWPIFVANLIFARRFSATAHATAAFGANLVGAMVGGLLEYSTLVLGARNLVLVVALVYAAALLTRPRDEPPPHEPVPSKLAVGTTPVGE